MKFHFSLLAVFFLFTQCIAQKQQLQFALGTNFNGTGDTKGLGFLTEYNKKFKKRLSWSVSLGGTINDGSFGILYEYPQGQQRDGSVRYTIAGFQGTSHLGFSVFSSNTGNLVFRLGSVIRYQSSSYWDIVNILYEPITGLPYPVIVFENTSPQKTLALGGSSQLSYSYTLKNRICLGILASFQFDTQGDTISQLLFTIGKRF
ncbi:MAG: hypothetical protein FJ340_02200 [Sphingomonadales bacterium]|nr:hypothetical protein [Sphingomonadales bacterium]